MKVGSRKLRAKIEQRRDTARVLKNGPHGLLAPLTRKPLSRRAQELIELVRTLQGIEVIEANLADTKYQGNVYPEDAPGDLYSRANEILSACHWSPRVNRPPDEPVSFTWNRRTSDSDWENIFVRWVLNLRASGDISLIRTCRNCEQWFYAVTNHQAFCRDRCRQDFRSMGVVFKEQRRLYMRLYRKNEKSRHLRAIQLLGERAH